MCSDAVAVHESFTGGLHILERWLGEDDEGENDTPNGEWVAYKPKPITLGSGEFAHTVTVQSQFGRASVNLRVGGLTDLLTLGLFPSDPATFIERRRGGVVYIYTRPFCQIATQLSEKCACSHLSIQQVYAGELTPDKNDFNEMLLNYRFLTDVSERENMLAHRLARESLAPSTTRIHQCGACFRNPNRLLIGDGNFKMFKQVRTHSSSFIHSLIHSFELHCT